MKFSIRDLLWLTVVIGLCLGWWRERSILLSRIDAIAIEYNGLETRGDRILARRNALVEMIEAKGWRVYIGGLDADGGDVQSVLPPNSQQPSQ